MHEQHTGQEFIVKKKGRFPIKDMVVAYLAISKAMYWLSIVAGAEGFDGVWRAVLERLIGRDIVIILLVISIYTFEYIFVIKRKKWTGNLAQAVLIAIGYVIYVVIVFAYILVLNLILQESFNLRSFLEGFFRRDFLNLSISYFIIAAFIFLKESFKKKEAYTYALEIQCKDIKLETLKALLDDGVLSQEEFDIQKVKLLEM